MSDTIKITRLAIMPDTDGNVTLYVHCSDGNDRIIRHPAGDLLGGAARLLVDQVEIEINETE